MRALALVLAVLVCGCGDKTSVYRPDTGCYVEQRLPSGKKILVPAPCPTPSPSPDPCD